MGRIQEVTYEEGWGGGGRSDLLFHVCKFCMVEQCVVLMSSKIFFKVVQLIGKLWCIFLSDFGIDLFIQHLFIKRSIHKSICSNALLKTQ